ncbi:hypothetical protein PJI17_21635 [Mycobacterium kansasii]
MVSPDSLRVSAIRRPIRHPIRHPIRSRLPIPGTLHPPGLPVLAARKPDAPKCGDASADRRHRVGAIPGLRWALRFEPDGAAAARLVGSVNAA